MELIVNGITYIVVSQTKFALLLVAFGLFAYITGGIVIYVELKKYLMFCKLKENVKAFERFKIERKKYI